MAVTADQTRAFTDFLTSMFSDLQEKHRSALEKQIEIQKDLLGQYRQSIERERSSDTDAFQNFTKAMMSTFMQAVTMQRETRMRVLDLHASVTEAHLKLLEQMKEGLASAAAANSQRAGKRSDGGAKRK